MTPHVARSTTTQTETEIMRESTEKRDRTHEKYVRNPENIPYYEGDIIYQRINRKYGNKQQFDKDGQVIDSSEEDFEQPSDENAQGNVLTMHQLNIDGVDDTKQMPNKQDAKTAAEEEEQASPSPSRQDR
jgi:hypothetical protein